MYKLVIKRSFDFFGALLLILLTLPVFIVVALLLIIANKGTPFFIQKRPGKNERIFSILKFKTMNDAKDVYGNLLPDGERLTKIGSVIRKTSLDEIPQLLNVLKGEMSFIGPRPLLIRYLPYYTEQEKKRHDIRPGITGLAQVSGRNLLHWEARLSKDVYYVENLSLVLDVKIVFKTIINVLSSKDIVIDPSSTLQDLDEYRK
ncbi:sugar transferase [Aquimarina agarilytica]|uniref:sugar transferase n=1 Tax=Aquimarina agarilytica TaxID=1087449 RepID=UPI000287A8BF|nr:sugar transferase [Aquimarina agarilytica]